MIPFLAYLLFAVTTAIYAHFALVRVVISEIRGFDSKNPSGVYWPWSYLTFFCLNIIFAPFLFLSLIFVKNGTEIMRNGLFRSLTEKISA